MPSKEATRHRLAASSELEEGGRLVLDVADTVIGVFRVEGHLYAYENVCAHQGGPACQGRLIPKVIEKLGADKESLGMDFDSSDPHVVCPWHGFEYSIKTGTHATIPEYRLRSFPVEERDGAIHVTI